MCLNCAIINLTQISIPVATLVIVTYTLKKLKDIENESKTCNNRNNQI